MDNDDQLYKKGEALRLVRPEKAVLFFQKSYELALEKKDTISAIKGLIVIADVHAHNVNYSKAYDTYWKALLLAKKIESKIWSGRVYYRLGFLYSFFKRDSITLKYFNLALKSDKVLYQTKKIPTGYILSDYFAFVNFYRTNGKYDIAQKYLDSSMHFHSKNNNKSYYVNIERGFLLSQKGEYGKGFEILLAEKAKLKTQNDPYIIVVNYLLGYVHLQLGEFQKGEDAFLESLEAAEKFKSHANYKLMNYDALAELYSKTNQYKKAFEYMKTSKNFNDEIFGSKSKSNQELLNIKDNYRLTIESQQKREKELRLKEFENEERIGFLKLTVLVIFLIVVIIFSYLFVRKLRLKHRLEKQCLNQRQKDELELKNRELTVSTLQLIEKEEFLSSLNEKISQNKKVMDVDTIQSMLKSVRGSSLANWKEFDTRFTSINQSFYQKLNAEFPDLGTTDQKICSLIKLNFSSKEMATLLGISAESVFTSRYRLRKKLNLDKDENLVEFMNRF